MKIDLVEISAFGKKEKYFKTMQWFIFNNVLLF